LRCPRSGSQNDRLTVVSDPTFFKSGTSPAGGFGTFAKPSANGRCLRNTPPVVDVYRSVQMARLMTLRPMGRRRRRRLRLPNGGRDRAIAQPPQPALLLEAQPSWARAAPGGCCRNSSQRTGAPGAVGFRGGSKASWRTLRPCVFGPLEQRL
jgi:hypothetical protein